ncbi:unnamed protein product [Paramecium primaurelia]|uniref:WD40-repeat-containing domain n=1 Tax=Paramecium primaurelia TaxID=5886 RepID=A0A8S1KED4_PARPR|nr:unnamed protein product [Paramecium primaurelia]
MLNPQQFHIQKNNTYQGVQLSCKQHKQPLNSIDLSLMCERQSRMKCSQCQLDENCIPISIFGNLCENIYQNIEQNNFQATHAIQLKFQKQIEEIQDLLQQLNNKLMKITSFQRLSENSLQLINNFVNCKKKLENEILNDSTNTYQQDQIIMKFGIQEFQQLAEVLSKHTILNKQNLNYTLKFKDIDDQQLAESNQYFEFIQNLKQQILNFKQENDIKNVENIQNQQVNQLNSQIKESFKTETKIQRILQIKKSEKMFLKEKCSIADIQLNYDQSILCIRQVESKNYISFWKYDAERKKWNFWTQLQCYIQSLIDFKMSKLENAFITCGEDFRQNTFQFSNNIENSYSIKIWRKEADTWINKQIYKPIVSQGHGISRISQVIFSKSEKQIYYSEGNRLVQLELKEQNYEFKYQQVKSSEIITSLEISNDGKILAVGAFDQKVNLWRIDEAKLILIQQLKLYNSPKRILFSQNDQDLIICTKDGLVHCFNNSESKQREYKENQKIFNNNAKIRTIQFNNDSSVLAIGGESNVLQLWQKDQLNQWKCYNESKQDNFIESICFSNGPDYIYASNNNELYIHHII